MVLNFSRTYLTSVDQVQHSLWDQDFIMATPQILVLTILSTTYQQTTSTSSYNQKTNRTRPAIIGSTVRALDSTIATTSHTSISSSKTSPLIWSFSETRTIMTISSRTPVGVRQPHKAISHVTWRTRTRESSVTVEQAIQIDITTITGSLKSDHNGVIETFVIISAKTLTND